MARGGTPVPDKSVRQYSRRTLSWLNAFGLLRRCPERSAALVDLFLFLAASIIVIQLLLRATLQTFRWPPRSTTQRLR